MGVEVEMVVATVVRKPLLCIVRKMRPSKCLSLFMMVAALRMCDSFTSSQLTPSQTLRHTQAPPIIDHVSTIRHQPPPTAQLRMSETIEDNTRSIDDDVSTAAGDQSISPASSNRKNVVLAGLTALSAVCLAAKTGILPGIPLGDGTFAPYTDSMIARDTGSTLLALCLAYIFVKGVTQLAIRDVLDPKDSRKIIHTLTGPLFIATWPLFSAAWGARFFAGLVGIVNSVRLILAASGNQEEAELANAVSRSGDAKEALGGPFLYVTTITASIFLFWRSTLPGIIAVSTMAAGDGMADLVGRRFGKNNKWSFSKDKSIVGSAAFVVASSLTSTALAAWMSYTGCLELPLPIAELVPRIVAISFLSAGVELLPFVDDNWTVPLSAAVLSQVLLY